MRKLPIFGQDSQIQVPALNKENGLPKQKNPVKPKIETVFSNGYPEGYRPWIEGWSVSKEELEERLPDGTFTMPQMDICISNDEYIKVVNEGFTPGMELTEEDRKVINARAKKKENYQLTCGIDCQHCFECNGETRNLLMTTEEVFEMLLEAKKLGLKQVKFLGPGELMHNKRLFEILDFLKSNDIKIAIFTKGAILGDDNKAQEVFGMSAKELSEKVAAYDNVSILLGLTSFDRETEQKRIDSRNFPNLFEIRNTAIENLCNVGMNKDPKKQRLAFVCAPVLKDNIDEVIDIYRFGLARNIPVIVAPTMLSGKGGMMKEITDANFKEKNLVKLYIEIYSMLVREQIFSLEQLEIEGISPYAGYACNQVVGGMIVRKDGQAGICPGNDCSALKYSPDVRKQPLREIWKNSLGYKLREQLVESGTLSVTQPCYAKTESMDLPGTGVVVKKGCGSIPENFYQMVIDGIRERVKNCL